MMKLVSRCIFAILFALTASVSFAQSLYTEGQHYVRLKSPQPVQSGAAIEVLEIFSYACVHCAHLEPHMEKWRATMPKNAKFVGLPAIFQESWVLYARAYYAAESLGIVEKSHGKLFHYLWEEKKTFANIDEMARWYSQFGVKPEQFTAAFTASGMEVKLKAVMDTTPKYEVSGTPTLVVDGKYKFDVGSAGGMDKVGPLINHLIAKAAAERGKK